MNEATIGRFWAKAQRGELNECWPWLASGANGYGKFWVNSKWEYAHRVCWTISFGCIPGGTCVLHHCDNPLCVNPSHLFLGTRADNARDCVQKGRSCKGPRHRSQLYPEGVVRGPRHGMAKLTPEDIPLILRWYGIGVTQRGIGEKLGVGTTTIGDVLTGRTWSHVSGRRKLGE